MMYIYHFNKQPKFCEIAPTEELCAKMYLRFFRSFYKDVPDDASFEPKHVPQCYIS